MRSLALLELALAGEAQPVEKALETDLVGAAAVEEEGGWCSRWSFALAWGQAGDTAAHLTVP
jgi:hypothetical protein